MALPASLTALQMAAQRLAPVQSADQGAAALQALDDPLVNVGLMAPVFATNPHAGAGEMASNDANADMASTAMGGGPAVEAMQRMSDYKRRNAFQDQQADDADILGGEATRRVVGQAGVENAAQDALSEGAGRRQTLPYTAEAARQAAARKQAELSMQYILPTQMRGQNEMDLQAARGAQATAEIDAKTAAEPTKAYLNTIMSLLSPGGKGATGGVNGLDALTPEVLQKLQALFGLTKPAAPSTPPVR